MSARPVWPAWLLRESGEWTLALCLMLLVPWAHYRQTLAPGLEQVQALQDRLRHEVETVETAEWERWASDAMRRMQAQVAGLQRLRAVGQTPRRVAETSSAPSMAQPADARPPRMGGAGRLVRLDGVGPEDVVWTAVNRYYSAPYRFGGESVLGIDCSALVQGVFADLGVELPRTAQGQFDARIGAYVGAEDLRPGDLVFFHTRRKPYVSHVGIYLGQDEFLHAPRTGRRVEIAAFTGYYRQRFIAGKRVLADPFAAYNATKPGG